MKCRSRGLAIYRNGFILDSARVSSEMINWKATNTISNYCISKSHTCHITCSLFKIIKLFICTCVHLYICTFEHVLKMSSSSANASGKRWHHWQPAGSTTTCISQGSVATVLKWNGQKYSHLRQVSSGCCMQKKYYNRLMFYGTIQK